MKSIHYTNFILTVIAGLLAWSVIGRNSERTVHAQDAPGRFLTKTITAPIRLDGGDATFASQLNAAVGDQDIVAVVPTAGGEQVTFLLRNKK